MDETTPRTESPTTKRSDTISALSCRVYRVPTDQPEADGTLSWNETTVVVVEVHADGTRGTGWTYASPACQVVVNRHLADELIGKDLFDIAGLHEAMVRGCRNFGRSGVVASAISAVDIALWDLKARCLDTSLAKLFGCVRAEVPVYGSGGFTTYDDKATVAQLQGWLGTNGMTKVKIKIGESWGSEVGRDLGRVGLCREVVGDGVELFVDANGGYSVKQARRVGTALEDLDVVWFEEPVSSDDLAGLHMLREQLSMDVTAGEYGYDEMYFARMLEAQAVDCLQIDVTRCGGYTSFLRSAAIAGAHNMQISAHCAPSLHAPVASAAANLRHVEYFHDHVRVDELLFDGALQARAGVLRIESDVLGHGMSLKYADAAAYLLA